MNPNARHEYEARKEAELRASQERFHTIHDASPTPFMLFRSVRDEAGQIIDFEWEYANPVGAAFTPRDADDLQGRRLLEEMPGNRETGLFDHYVNVVESGEPWEDEFSYTHEGLNHFFRAQAVKVEDGFGVMFHDITAERRATQELREREQRFRALVELIPQLVWSTTPEGYHDYFNQRWYDYTGMERGDNQGWNWKDYLHPDDYERTLEVWNHSLATGAPYEIEYRFRRASDGSYRWFIGRALPLRGPDGEIERWFGTCTDVHDERTALEAAEQSQERFRAVTHATADAVWDWDLVSGTIWWNENLKEVFGIEPDALGSSLEAWSSRLHPEDRQRVLDGLETAIAGDAESWSDEYRFTHGNGDIVYVLDRGRIMRDTDGRAVRMLGSMIDLTDRYQLEEELRQAQKLEAIGKLAGGIAHDFNNLLTVITNYSDMLLGDLDSKDRMRNDVAEIHRAASKAASLTRQLLAFGRRQVLQPRALDLNGIVLEMEKLLRRVIGEEIQLITSPVTASRTVHADPGQIEQVIMNLALNARDAMPAGGVLTLTTEDQRLDPRRAERWEVEPGDYVVLTVEDTGIGMDLETQSRMFEPFFTTKALGEGTGLGLSTVHGIVVQSRGYVDVDSRPGEGTTFRVWLPAGTGEPSHEEPSRPPTTARGRTGTVLVVEDEEVVRGIAVRVLTRYGYQVLEAANGAEALSRHLNQNAGAIDLVLSDLVMPEMGGRKLAEHMEQLDNPPPVLFMSGYAEVEMLPDESFRSGQNFLEKPFTVEQLVNAVDALCGVRSNGQLRQATMLTNTTPAV